MPITDSRVREGVLTLDGTSFATQATNVRITPSHEEQGARIEVLDGSEILPALKRRNTLAIEAIQDFTDADGLIAFSWSTDTTEQTFSWTPGPDAPTYSGSVQVLAIEVGGTVGERLTTTAEWEIVGDVTVTPAV
jgi:hypothetical protein